MSAFVTPIFPTPTRCRASYRCSPRATAAPQPTTREPSATVQAVAARLREELPALFDDPSTADYSLYTDSVTFEDPLNKFRGVSRYASNINFLNSSPVFCDAKLSLYDVAVIGPDLSTVRTRWALQMVANLPWKPCVAFTGQSDYVVNDEGKVYRHIDYWDSLEDSTFFSPSAVVDLLSQCKPGRLSPLDLDGFQLLRRTADFEVRKFAKEERDGVSLKPIDRQDGLKVWQIGSDDVDPSLCRKVNMVAAAAIDIRDLSAKALELRMKELRASLDKVEYATARSDWFLVKSEVSARTIYEIWLKLENANATVDE